jgi:hypothetical protein
MATLEELTASITALQQHQSATLAEVQVQIADLEARTDPALLDPLHALLDPLKGAVAQMAQAIGGAPPAPAPADKPELLTFSGDPATVDLSIWPRADVNVPDGQALYGFSGPTLPSPLPDGWALYTGPTEPVPAAA